MNLAIGMIVLLLVAFFSILLGMLVAATIGIKRNDRGHYRALRNGRGTDRTFSGAGRTFTGLRFVPDGSAAEGDDEDATEGGDEKEDGSAFGRTGALV
ncbi:hypothetical protein FZ103_00855 [Streptomonospora sp. PA3]|uniref:hypothetical protein n=1 Tax=Streptomonospora sp. PA3 TaxID=2607326 RepID=UPI0012DC4763|nr:hypothetical protein [Streptomonospora sp. PA3]MUL39740.1 hypothetical protein [Streptomonospora sp. PA3]